MYHFDLLFIAVSGLSHVRDRFRADAYARSDHDNFNGFTHTACNSDERTTNGRADANSDDHANGD